MAGGGQRGSRADGLMLVWLRCFFLKNRRLNNGSSISNRTLSNIFEGDKRRVHAKDTDVYFDDAR